MRMQDEIDDFHEKIRARALLIALEWAGSARKLSKACGLSPDAGVKWVQRNEIPPLAALSLSLISGFPLTFQEMRPAENVRTYMARFQCPRCLVDINPPRTRTGCSPLLMARSEARARKLASKPVAQILKQRTAKRKAAAAKRA